MTRKKQPTSDFQVEFKNGGTLARRKAQLLPDGAYLFEDELKVEGALATVITCVAWLLELYELRAGELVFVSNNERISPKTRCFGVLYPPFSMAQPSCKSVQGHLLGIAATDSLPPEFTAAPVIFDTPVVGPPSSVAQVIEILNAGANRQPIALNSKPSLVSLKAKRLIDESYLVYPSIARVASRLGVTHEHLSRQFKRDFGMSPSAYLHQLRLADAPLRLAKGEEIVNVSLDVGYNDLSRFYKQFRKVTKTSPGFCRDVMKPGRT